MYSELRSLRENILSDIREVKNDLTFGNQKTFTYKDEKYWVKYYIRIVNNKIRKRIEPTGYKDIDKLTEEIDREISSIEYGTNRDDPCYNIEKSYEQTKSTKNQKVSKKDIKPAIVFFLDHIEDIVDHKITWYLYDEAQALKGVLERIDSNDE
jgi:hypothetical protein